MPDVLGTYLCMVRIFPSGYLAATAGVLLIRVTEPTETVRRTFSRRVPDSRVALLFLYHQLAHVVPHVKCPRHCHQPCRCLLVWAVPVHRCSAKCEATNGRLRTAKRMAALRRRRTSPNLFARHQAEAQLWRRSAITTPRHRGTEDDGCPRSCLEPSCV